MTMDLYETICHVIREARGMDFPTLLRHPSLKGVPAPQVKAELERAVSNGAIDKGTRMEDGSDFYGLAMDPPTGVLAD